MLRGIQGKHLRVFDFRRSMVDEMFDSNSNVSKVSKFVSSQQLRIIALVGF